MTEGGARIAHIGEPIMSLRTCNTPLETLAQTQYAHAVLNMMYSRNRAIANRFNPTGDDWLINLRWWETRVTLLASQINPFDIHEIRILVIEDLAGFRNINETNARYEEAMRIALKSFIASTRNLKA